MNNVTLIFRFLASLTYFSISIRMFVKGHIYAGVMAVFIGLVILFPAVFLLYKSAKPLTPSFLKEDLRADNIIVWIRKGLAMFFGMTVVGAFERDKYATGVVILLVCLVMLSPLDKAIFDRRIFQAPQDPGTAFPARNWRGVLIMTGRNLGVILYVSGAGIFSDSNYDPAAMSLLITGAALLFTGPVVMLLAPYKATSFAEPESDPGQ